MTEDTQLMNEGFEPEYVQHSHPGMGRRELFMISHHLLKVKRDSGGGQKCSRQGWVRILHAVLRLAF